MRRFADKIPWTTLLSIAIAGFPLFALLVVTSAAYAIRWAELSDQIEGHRLEIKKVGWIADNSDRLSADLLTVENSRSSETVLGAGDPELAGVDLQNNVKTLLD